jgi:Ku70/Ku80 beta-barrel domain
VCNVTVERGDLGLGYEFVKNHYVQLTEGELESLEAESSNNIELKEFIPLSKIDPVYFESAYYLGAGEGGEKPYRLLAVGDAFSFLSGHLIGPVKHRLRNCQADPLGRLEIDDELKLRRFVGSNGFTDFATTLPELYDTMCSESVKSTG